MPTRAAQDGLQSLYLHRSIGVADQLWLTMPHTTTALFVPDLVARIDRATASVYEQAPAGARLRVELMPSARSQWITATASGHYTATFADLAPLTYAYGTLTYEADSMKQVRLSFSTNRWTVALGESCVDGVGEMAGKPLTVTLESSPGTVREVITRPASYDSQFAVCFARVVEAGDRLVLSYQADATNGLVLPVLMARHDFARQVVLGQTLPAVRVDVQVPSMSVARRVCSDAGGDYGADLSDRALPLGTVGSVSMTDADGNAIIRRFSVIGLTRYLPMVRK